MKKIITTILAIMLIGVLGVAFVACDKDDTPKNTKDLTSTEAESILFGNNGAMNFASKVFNVKVDFAITTASANTAGEAILVLDETNEENFATVYHNETIVEDGVEDTYTYFAFLNWVERKGELENKGLVVATKEGDQAIAVDTYASGYESLHNNLVKQCGIHLGKTILESHIHNPNDDIYDTIVYSAKATYSDSALTDMTKVEVTMTYNYEYNGQTINGTAVVVLEKKDVKIYDGSTDTGFVLTSVQVTESNDYSMSVTYTYGIDTIDLPDVDDPEANWPEKYPIA